MSVIEQETTTTTVEQEQVRRGADWLDENHLGWDETIDLTRLDLKSCSKCVVGQLLDSNDIGYWEYWNFLRDNEIDDRALGFHAHNEIDDRAWDRLTEAWRDEVTSRR